MPRSSRILALDILRGCAVLLVIGRHQTPFPEGEFFKPLMDLWLRGGWIGVDLFFVLSGFFVSGLLFREHLKYGSLSFPRFFVRRGFKIYPSFYVMIATTVLVYHAVGRAIPPRRLWSELLYLQSYRFGLWDHTWSLAVEEHFYVLLPLTLILLLLGHSRSPDPFRAVPLITGVLAVGCLALRIERAVLFPFTYIGHLFATHLRLDGLAFGVLISYGYHYHQARFQEFTLPRVRALVVAGIALLLPAFVWQLETHPFIYTGGLTLFYLGSGLIMASALDWELPSSGIARLLGFIGAQSYSIYLWHLPTKAWIVPWLERALPTPPGPLLDFAVYFLAALATGIVTGLLVEVPFLRLRDRLFPSRSVPLAAPA